MFSDLFTVKTGKSSELVNISPLVEDFLKEVKAVDGICVVFVPHTTCGITINENADPDVKRDILMELDKIVPIRDGYMHGEGNSAAHIKSSMVGFSVTVPVLGGKPVMGIWQGIYLCEFDGPRNRNVRLSFISD